MSKLSPVSRDDLIKKLRIFGFEGPCIGGKHQYMVKNNLRLTIPNPHKEEISVDLLARILKQAEVSREEWLKK